MPDFSGRLKPIKKVSGLISSEIIPYSQIETLGSEVFSLPLYTAGVPFPAVPISISTMAF
jgi:hypothetical protein